jgi:hypothetical protein
MQWNLTVKRLAIGRNFARACRLRSIRSPGIIVAITVISYLLVLPKSVVHRLGASAGHFIHRS